MRTAHALLLGVKRRGLRVTGKKIEASLNGISLEVRSLREREKRPWEKADMPSLAPLTPFRLASNSDSTFPSAGIKRMIHYIQTKM